MLKFLTSAAYFPHDEAGDKGGAGVGGKSAEGGAGPGEGNKSGADAGKTGAGGNEGTGGGSGDSLLDGADDDGGKEGEGVGDQIVDFSKGMPEGFPKEAWDEKTKAPKADVLFNQLKAAQKRADELRAKMGTGAHKAPKKPEDYKFTPSEKAAPFFEKNDPMESAARKAAVEAGISKEAFEKFMPLVADAFADIATKRNEEGAAELSEEQKQEIKTAEYAKIGPNAKQVIRAVESWARGLKETGMFSEADLATFKSMATNGEQVRVLNKLRTMSAAGRDIPMDATDDGLPSDEEIATMQANVKTEDDQKKIDKLLDKRIAAGRPTKLQIR